VRQNVGRYSINAGMVITSRNIAVEKQGEREISTVLSCRQLLSRKINDMLFRVPYIVSLWDRKQLRKQACLGHVRVVGC
jgi:hypothetical protein